MKHELDTHDRSVLEQQHKWPFLHLPGTEKQRVLSSL